MIYKEELLAINEEDSRSSLCLCQRIESDNSLVLVRSRN